jgi:phage terminase large subunit-like protein
VPVPGRVFVREVYARGAKEDRAEPVATAYERGRVSHVIGADLVGLEDTLTTWEPLPGNDSPGDLDALVHAMVELLDLSKNTLDPRQDFKGIGEVAKQILAPRPTVSLSHAISLGRRNDRI